MANKIVQMTDPLGNNIFPIAYAQGGVKMDLLWTNTSLTTSYPATSLTLDLSGYDLILIDYVLYSNSSLNSNVGTAISLIDGNLHQLYFSRGATSMASGTLYSYQRPFRPLTTGVNFDTGYASNGIQAWTSDANICVPWHIYGIKTSYIVPTSVNGLQYVEV